MYAQDEVRILYYRLIISYQSFRSLIVQTAPLRSSLDNVRPDGAVSSWRYPLKRPSISKSSDTTTKQSRATHVEDH
jgi:hypothetical protein